MTTSIDDVRGLIADQLGLGDDEVKAHSRIVEDLGAESMDVANIMAAVQDRYGVTVPDEEVAKYATVSDIYRGIAERKP
jgi:acyl carrier protein